MKDTILDCFFIISILYAFAEDVVLGLIVLGSWIAYGFFSSRFQSKKPIEEYKVKEKQEKNSQELTLELEESNFRKKEEREDSKREHEKDEFELEKEERELKVSEYLDKLPENNDKIEPLKEELEDLGNELENNLELEFSLKQKYIKTKFLRDSFNERTWYRGEDGEVEPMISFGRYPYESKQYDHIIHNPYTYEDSELRKKVKLDIKQIRGEITKLKNKIKYQIEKQKNLDKIKEKSIRIAGYEGKSREIARGEIVPETEYCPYCGNDLGDEPHQDHIFPIKKGGLSKKENLVYVCKECNIKKSSLTLNQFIKKCGMDRDFIESNLEKLGKDF